MTTLDIDAVEAFVLVAEIINLRHAGYAQQDRAQRIGVIVKLYR